MGTPVPHLILNSASRCSRKQLRPPDCSDDAGRQVLARYDSAAGFGILLSLTSGRGSLRQREMRPVFVIIANVLPHQTFQMPLIQNNYMVKQLASAVPDPALGHAVLPRTAEPGSLRLNAEALHSVDHFLIKIG